MTIVRDRGWEMACPPWKESFSGRKSSRPVFEDILTYLDEHPRLVRYYLFRSIDRFTRGGSYSYEHMKRELSKRGVAIVDTLGIIQPTRNTLDDVGFEYEWSRVSPSEVAEVVVATAAKQEVSTILTRLISQEIRLTQRGFKIRRPDDGYRNKKIYVEGKRRTIQEPDPDRARYFEAMFELRASGQYSDQEICDRVNEMGYRTKPHHRWDVAHRRIIGQTVPRPLIPKRLQEIIQRPVYCGVILEKWTNQKPILAAYRGLVTVDLFNAANRGKIAIIRDGEALSISYNGEPSHLRARLSSNNPEFPFRHVVVCPECRKPLWGSSPRGRSGQRFPTYHCARKHSYRGYAKATLEAWLADYVAGLTFTPYRIDRLVELCRQLFSEHMKEIAPQAGNAKDSRAALTQRKDELGRAYVHATTDVMRQNIEAQMVAVQRQAEEFVQTHRETITEEDLGSFLEEARFVLEHPQILLKKPVIPDQIKALYRFVYVDFPTADDLRLGTAKTRWFFSSKTRLSSHNSVTVRPHDPRWNRLEQEVLHWKCLAPDIHGMLDSP